MFMSSICASRRLDFRPLVTSCASSTHFLPILPCFSPLSPCPHPLLALTHILLLLCSAKSCPLQAELPFPFGEELGLGGATHGGEVVRE